MLHAHPRPVVEQQTALGQTLLPQTLTSLLKGALNDTANSKSAINELLRVAANLCMDHGAYANRAQSRMELIARATDENRGFLLEAGFPQTVLSLLESYAESVKPAQREAYPMSIPDLKIVKTAIGFLLNASVGYGTCFVIPFNAIFTYHIRRREGSFGFP